MIKIFYLQGRYVPKFICDVCEERIDQASEGTAFSPMPSNDAGVLSIAELAELDEIGDPEQFEVFHVHRGKCSISLEQRFLHEKTDMGSNRLDEHVYHLTRGLGLTLDDLRQIEDDL